jgi:Methyltransferase FkbM domain
MNTFGESPNRRLMMQGAKQVDEPTVTVACSTLADFLQERRLESVDFLKMDVEGSEWEILHSTPMSVLRRIRHIALEYHEIDARFGHKPEQLFAYLAAAGHKLTYRQEDRDRTGLAFFSVGETHTGSGRLCQPNMAAYLRQDSFSI